MASLLSLPLEIVDNIFSDFWYLDPGPCNFHPRSVEQALNTDHVDQGLAAMARLCRTSRQLRELIEPHLYRFVCIPNATVTPLVSLLRCWDARPHCAEYTRRLTIETKQRSKEPVPPVIREEDVAFISGMAKRMGLYLRGDWHEFHWNSDVLVELAMFRARYARNMEILFMARRGIYRPPFDFMLTESDSNAHIRFDNLQSLHIVQPGGLTMDELRPVMDRAPNLSKLHLDMCQFSNRRKALPTGLTSLCLKTCPIPAITLESTILDLDSLSHLEFDVVCNPVGQERVLRALSKHAQTLKSLVVSFRTRQMTHMASSGRVKTALGELSNLESLTTDLKSFGFGVSGLVQSLPTFLRELRIVSSEPATAQELELFAAELMALDQEAFKDLSVHFGAQGAVFNYH